MKPLLVIALIVSLYFNYSQQKEVRKTKSENSRNEFVIEYLEDNNPSIVHDVKAAYKEYEDGAMEAASDRDVYSYPPD